MTITNTEKLYHQLHYCTNLLHRGHGLKEGHGRSGVHRGQGRIMSLLRTNDGISQRALAELLHIRPPSLSEVLDKLETTGLIERRQHETDKRVSNVFITPKGREAAMEVETTRRNQANEMFAGLSASEQENLSELLGKLITTLETKAGDEDDSNLDHHGGAHHCHKPGEQGHEYGRHARHGGGRHGHHHKDGSHHCNCKNKSEEV